MHRLNSLITHQKLLQRIALSGVVFMGIAIRLIRLPWLTVWSDEYHTINTIQMSFLQIFSGQLPGEYNPPLYFGLLRFYLKVAGNSEIAMRSFSVLFSIATIILFYLLAKELLIDFIPIIGALLIFSFHPMYVYYADEIRSYALLTFSGLFSFLCFIKYRNNSDHSIKWLALLFLSLTFGIYIHYFGFLILISLGAAIMIDILRTRTFTRVSKYSLLIILISILAFIPGIELLLHQVQSYPTNTQNLVQPQVFFQIITFSIHHPEYEPVLLFIGIASLILGLSVLIKQKIHRVAGYFLGSALFFALLALLIAYFAKINLLPRYLLGVSPLVIIASAGTLTLKGKSWGEKFIFGTGLVLTLFYVWYGVDFVMHTNQENQFATWKSDWKQVSFEIKSNQLKNELFMITAWDQNPVQYYLNQTAASNTDILKNSEKQGINSYLVIESQNTDPNFSIENAKTIYEDRTKSIRILRVYVNPSQ